MGNLIKTYQGRINSLLDALMIKDETLQEAISYSLLNPGKRLRPLLVYGAGLLVNAPVEKLDNAAMAVECIHAYSLIHDDLPCMDNDDTRRGKPACHKQFNEAQAILAGDALQALAFEVLAQNESYEQIIVLAKACGREGMALGQSLDMQNKGKKIPQKTLHKIHQLKTGRLITASIMLGMMCGEVDETTEEVLAGYAENFGLAFQLRDDLLDKEHQNDAEEMKKLFEKSQKLLKTLSGKETKLLLNIGEMLSVPD